MERILVTGADGFIGKNVVDRLADRYELTCIVRNRSYRRGGVKMIYGDVSDSACLDNALNKIDVVIHLAAVLNPFDKNITRVNVGSTRLIVEKAVKNNVKKIIFISSENVLYDFDDAYSRSKKIGEKIVKKFHNHLILRPTVVYGKYDHRYVYRIADMADRFKFVVVPGNGKKRFQPVYIDDVVTCIENGLKNDVRGEYIVAGPSKIDYNDFVKTVLDELGVDVPVLHIPLSILKFIDFANKTLKITQIRIFQIKSLETDKVHDIKKSVKALKYKPTPFDAGVRRTLQDYL